MSDATKQLEKLLAEKTMRVGTNPVARWMAANIAVKIDAGEQMRPDKEKSTERFDGIEALIMAIALGLTEEVQDTGVMFV
jgi:phage terminase large subunit-like protein